MIANNVGLVDARLRILGATLLGLVALALNAASPPGASFLAALIALVLLATGLTRVCPLYTLLGIDTSRPVGAPKP